MNRLFIAVMVSVVAVGCAKRDIVRTQPKVEAVSLAGLLEAVHRDLAKARDATQSSATNSGTLVQSIELELAITNANSTESGEGVEIGIPLPVAEFGFASSTKSTESLQALNRIKLILTNPLFTQHPGERLAELCKQFEEQGLLPCKPAAR